MEKGKNKKQNLEKKLYSLTVSSIILLSTYSTVYAAPISKLPNISNNSLVIGKHLFELDKASSSEYNLNKFVEAAKTVDKKNGIYYKYNGKWYTGKDIDNFTNLKNGKSLDTIPNDILKVNGKDPVMKSEFILDWYQDGDYNHDSDGQNESVEQFIAHFNKPVKANKGKFKIIVPNNKAKDPYGKDKLGVIECSVDGTAKAKALENVQGGAPVTCFIIKDKSKNKDIKKGFTDRFILELTEDWTRILNTENTGYKYEDVKGLKLVAEDFQGENEEKVEEITAKRDINLAKDTYKPHIIAHRPIYTKIGENGTQPVGKTRILFNEPIQLFTEKNAEELKKLGVKQPYVVGSFSKGKYTQYNPITPSQEQLKSKDKGVPVFYAEYRKINEKGEAQLDKGGKPIVVKGSYGLRGDVFEANDEIEENGDKIKLRLNELNFKYNFDSNNSGITRFRDYGTIFINPQKILSEGKWQLVVKNVTDDAGNKMEDYISDPIDIKKYFDVVKLTKNKIKIKFTKPFKKSSLWGNKIPIAVTNETGKSYAFTWINNLKDGQTEAEGIFTKPIQNLKGTVYVNTMEYKVDENAVEEPEENHINEKVVYKDGVYEGEGDGFKSSIKVKVSIKNGKLNNVDIVEQKDTPGYFNKAKAIVGKILNNQSTEVDAISKATYSSEGIKGAVANALQKAKVIQNDNNNTQNTDGKKKTDFKLDWYQDGDYSHDKDGKDESIEQFVVTLNKPIKSDKGTLKIIVPDKTKKYSYGKDKLGQIEIKLNGKNNPKALANVKGGEAVSCTIKKDTTDEKNNRFILELTQDWESILNTEKTALHYYDSKIKGLRLVGEGLQDEKGNIIEDTKGSSKITAERDIEMYKDESKPFVTAQKLIYDKVGENGVQKAGSVGVVFNEPIQVYTTRMAKNGIIPPVIYKDEDPLTPSPLQIGKYENFLPEFKAEFQKVDNKGNLVKDEKGNNILVKGNYDLTTDIEASNAKLNKLQKKLSITREEIPFKYDLDSQTSYITRFRGYGLVYINPETSLSEGNWRLVISNISDDAGNEMDKYISKAFIIKPYFSIESLNKEGIKIKFNKPLTKSDTTEKSLTLVVTKYGEIVNSAVIENLKEGDTQAEAKFSKAFKELDGEYFINNIKYVVKDK
ncbi:FMN-binding protein [Clostridium botulinum]|nr:FMN-binding protein [Clostridium botulinum]